MALVHDLAAAGDGYPWLALAAATVLSVLLVCAAWNDLKARRIPNGLVLGVALAAVPWWVGAGGAGGLLALLQQLALVAGVLAGLIALFALRVLGGGDVKLIAALTLWIAPHAVPGMLMAIMLVGGLLGLVVLILHRLTPYVRQPGVPYGIAIAIGAALALRPAVGSMMTAAGLLA